MKKTIAKISLLLAASLKIPASAADYTVEEPPAPNFAAPTSIETVTVGDSCSRTAVDTSKNSALIPPRFGSPTSNLRGSGEPLTPNLAADHTGKAAVGGISVQPTVTVTSTISQIVPGTIDTAIYEDYLTYEAFTKVTDDLYYTGGYLAKLIIPDLDISAKVYEGTANSVLAKGVGHFNKTSIWDGNVCLASHNRGTGAYFADINELESGAEIRFTTKLGTRKYEVYSVEKIAVDDISSLQNTSDNILTLITCVKYESDKYRWCVQAEQVE